MKLSDKTLAVLKNYSSINPNLVVHEGSTILTMAETRNICATVDVEETFPQTFGIYDLTEFLAALSLVSSPNLKFEKNFVTIQDDSNRSRIKYFFSDPEILTSPTKPITMPEAEVKFRIDKDVLSKLQRAAGSLGHDQLSITANDGLIQLAIVDVEDATSNAYSVDIDGEYEHENFSFVVNINNLRLIPGAYDVEFSSKLISQFTNVEDQKIVYWIALEKSSTYGNV